MTSCTLCNNRLLRHTRKLTCSFCKESVHLKCLPNVNISDSIYVNRQNDEWLCLGCNMSIFPFNHHVDDDEFTAALIDYFPCGPNCAIGDLQNTEFNPFDWNEDSDQPWFDSDPDIQYYNDVGCFQSAVNCNYYIEQSFTEKLHDLEIDSNNFSILHLNIRSLTKNMTDMELYLKKLGHQFTVLGFTETWLTTENADLYNLPGYQHFYLCRKQRKGGGLSLFVKDGIYAKECTVLNNMTDVLEALFIEIPKANTGSDKDTVIGLIYRPPNQSIDSFNEILFSKLDSLRNQGKHIYLIGDFNIDIMKHDDHIPTSEYLESMYSQMLFPLITKPTRRTNSSATLIDNIFTNKCATERSFNGILFTQISDHFPVFTINCQTKTKEKEMVIRKRIVNSRNLQCFIERLKTKRWDEIVNNYSGPEAFKRFHTIFSKLYDETFPLKVFKPSYKNRKPWLSKGLLTSIGIKNKLYLRQSRSPTDDNVGKYKAYKTKLKSLLKKAERAHYNELIEQNKSNTKKLWSILKEVINKRKSGILPQKFCIGGSMTSDPVVIANTFNKYFTNIGSDLAKKIPITNTNPLSYLNNSNSYSMYIEPVEKEEVVRIISKLRNASPGYDAIRSDVIKETYKYYLTPLVHVLNLSLTQGFFPDCMKVANVVPIYKSKDHNSIANYRPVSILPLFSKILERLMYNRLMTFISKHKILYQYQFGFRQGHSTTMAVTVVLDKIISAIDEGNIAIGVFLDFQKAFDTVNHNILVDKLEKYGVRGIALDWIKDYLQRRKQYVTFGHMHSDYLDIKCGVPQGSILGPLLFLLYINDLVDVSTVLTPIIFADDTNVFIKGTSVDTLMNTMNTELNKIYQWLNTNKLSLNISKTHYIIFKSKNRVIQTEKAICINGIMVDRVETTKFVGLHLDSSFKWLTHINNVKNKISKGMGIIYKARKLLNKPSLVTLYYSFIYPHLMYCVEAWGNSAVTYMDSLIKVQNRVVRIITSSSFYASAGPLYEELSILPFSDLFKQTVVIFMFKFVKGMLPPIFNNMFLRNYEVRDRLTRSRHKFYVPTCKTSLCQKSLRSMGPRLWNDIGESIDHFCSLHTFKRRVKSYLSSC